jgi:hypothetical protein
MRDKMGEQVVVESMEKGGEGRRQSKVRTRL